jgi:hypothetical protein
MEVLEELVAIHPAPDKLLQTFRDTFDGLIAFIYTKHIVTLPADSRPILQETPPFMRATTFASMDRLGRSKKLPKKPFLTLRSRAQRTHPKKSTI